MNTECSINIWSFRSDILLTCGCKRSLTFCLRVTGPPLGQYALCPVSFLFSLPLWSPLSLWPLTFPLVFPSFLSVLSSFFSADTVCSLVSSWWLCRLSHTFHKFLVFIRWVHRPVGNLRFIKLCFTQTLRVVSWSWRHVCPCSDRGCAWLLAGRGPSKDRCVPSCADVVAGGTMTGRA